MEPKKCAGFTLIELITVIAIIGLLASLLLTALSSARTSAKKTRARAEMDQIETAWQNYLQEYRRFPVTTISEMGEDAIEILRGDDTALAEEENRKKIIFLDFQQNQAGLFADPWGNVYHVALDDDGDNFLIADGASLPLTVAVWSDGPDGQPQTPDDLHNWN